jgi:serine/threonine protein kinase
MRMIGKTITGYKILKRIGKGGMGSVYLAKHTTLDKHAAIKVIDKKYSSDPEIKKRFKREAVLHSKLGRHNKIVELYNYIHEDDFYYILMEYFESVELATVIGKQTGPIPHNRAVPIFKQILDGIGHGHSRSIIHRDIKPSNILLNKDDEIKIADFGIAIDSKGDGRLTQIGHSVGTPIYMSPEQILAQEITEASDIYSLGVTFYEMLSGRPPFDVGHTEIRTAQVKTIPDPPTKHYPHIPENIVNAIMMSLNKNPKDRQQSCAEFSQQLEGKSDVKPSQIKNTPVKKPTDQQKTEGSGGNSILKWVGGLTAIGLVWLAVSEYSTPPSQCFDAGYNYYENDSYENAIKSFTKCVDQGSVKVDLYVYRGDSYDKLGKYDQALLDYDKAIILRGNYYDHNRRGWVHYRKKNLKKAITDFTSSIAKGNNKSDVYNGRAWSYYEDNKYSNAITDFNKAIDIFPKYDNAYYGRAFARFDSGNSSGALNDITKAMKIDGSNSTYFITRGLIFQEMNSLKNACKDFQKAKSLSNPDADYYIDQYCK